MKAEIALGSGKELRDKRRDDRRPRREAPARARAQVAPLGTAPQAYARARGGRRAATGPKGGGCEERVAHGQRRPVRARARTARAARLRPARAARADRDRRRLRHLVVRRLHGAARRRVGEVVHACSASRPTGTRSRRSKGWRRTARCIRCRRASTSTTRSSAATARAAWCSPPSSLLAENPSPSDDEIRHALEGNICRCTGYQNIVDAIEAVAR